MSKSLKSIIIVFFILILGLSFYIYQTRDEEAVINEKPTDRIFTNIEAFAKIYGYVRYFHPSDEATDLDWNRFAIYGVSKVKNASSEKVLKERLEELFLPIAPTMSIAYKGDVPKKLPKAAGEVVFWQYYGPPDEENLFYKHARVTATIKNGQYILRDDKLFDTYPKANETTTAKISEDLLVSVPLVLSKGKIGTLGSTKNSKDHFQQLKANLRKMNPGLSSADEDVRFAGMVVTWNILQHFYPYFHVTNSDWDHQLEAALKDTADDKTRDDYISSLFRLLEKTKDGHASMSFGASAIINKQRPFKLEIVENQVVITDALQSSSFKQGDIIQSLNGENPNDLIQKLSKEIPGSPQWKNYKALYDIVEIYQAVKIKRGDQILSLKVDNKNEMAEFNRNSPFDEIEKGIYYINLTADVKKEVKDNFKKLSNAKGIIFDLRGYPLYFEFMQEVIGHLTEKPVKGPIFRVMQIVYPDQKNPTYFEERDAISPQAPFFKGKIIFLAYPGTLSMPEYFLGYIKDNHLGQIIGQPTAGADGNIQTYAIPGSLNGFLTGAEILNADRSQTHLIGIQPDVLVERTLEGLKKGKDEYINKALEMIHQ